MGQEPCHLRERETSTETMRVRTYTETYIIRQTHRGDRHTGTEKTKRRVDEQRDTHREIYKETYTWRERDNRDTCTYTQRERERAEARIQGSSREKYRTQTSSQSIHKTKPTVKQRDCVELVI